MRVCVTGKNLEDFMHVLENYGMIADCMSPELKIAHGGDGTLLAAVRSKPDLPILPIRDCRTAPVCKDHSYQQIMERFVAGELSMNKYPMLQGVCNDKVLFGINDVFIHNVNRVAAIRYRVWIDDELYADEIVGDGAGVATILGSTAYYRSITNSTFRVGIGLAFSNSTEITNHLVLPETSEIKLQVTRGPAVMVADNSDEQIKLNDGDEIIISLSDKTVSIYGMDHFMCPKCRVLRHPNQYRFLNKSLSHIAGKL